MSTLTAFKQYLATPGATIRLAKYEILRDGEWFSMRPHNPLTRTVAKVQTNAVKLSDGSWLDLPKASQLEADNGNAVITLDAIRLTYVLGEGN